MIVGILRFSRYLLKVRVTKLRATFGWRGVAGCDPFQCVIVRVLVSVVWVLWIGAAVRSLP